VHQYVSDFYHNNGLEDVCTRQFDETALLTMGTALVRRFLILGIVIEELVRECIGEEGHRLFLEEDTEEETGECGATFGDTQDSVEGIDSESNVLSQGNRSSNMEIDDEDTEDIDEDVDEDADEGSLYSP
jgi:hypothetical protein